MGDVTRILADIERGDPQAAEQLLPLVYEELRKLAAQKMAQENPGQTLQATALVHDAYVRLVDHENAQAWDSRGHFFAAAAEAMRRILVDNARRRASLKNGGHLSREPLIESAIAATEITGDILAVDEALTKLARSDPQAAELVKLRFFTGLTIKQAAASMGISSRSADDVWAYARAWLLHEIECDQPRPAAHRSGQ
ncbi:MAG: sigma-70 family RNA polymerase sigma factor [Planctomycetia bacterium]|nr:sigma-70 family RNA polymerase sigma factor [Planctomycetia bacterium]